MDDDRPKIKGIFVNSHIKAVLRQKGPQAVEELEKRFGSPLRFKNSDDVPVRDEVRLIELALDILSDPAPPASARSFEAGRLHFRNFITTPFAKIINPLIRFEFHHLIYRLSSVAEYIFRGVKFSTREIRPNCAEVILENNDYPLDHFRGLFHEWLEFSGQKGSVTAAVVPPNKYVYTVEWGLKRDERE